MAQYDLNLRDYQRIFRRRWKVVLFATLLVAVFSYFFGRSRLPLYQTYSSVKIEETNTVAGLLLQKLTYTRWDNIATAQELIQSFPVMEKVAKRMGLIDNAMSAREIRQDTKLSALINNMISKVSTERNGRTNIIDIYVTSDDPYEAREISQNLAEVFSEEHLEQRTRQDRETREFIEEQLRFSKAALNAAEEQMQNYREQNPYPVLDDHIKIRIEELINIEQQKRNLAERIKELRLQRDQLQERIQPKTNGSGLRNPTILADGSISYSGEEELSQEYDIDWISSEEGSGPLGLLNERLVSLEVQKSELLKDYRPTYPKIVDLESQIKDLIRELVSEVSGNLSLMEQKKDSLSAYINNISAILDSVPRTQRLYSQLLREVSLRENQYAFLTEKHQEALIREADQADEVMVVRPAMLNSSPININMFRTISVGIVIGLMLGLVLAFLFETFDTSIGTIEDVEEYLQVPVMGVIPHIDIEAVSDRLVEQNPMLENNPNLASSARLVTHFAPKDPVAEAYRSLRTNLQFRSISRQIRTLVATSASLQEGKSTTLVNLAITLAQSGTRTLLVGCNLRRPTLYRIFGLEQEPGVTDIVLGRKKWQETIRTVTDIIMGEMGMESILMTPGMENLHIITSGGVPPNPSEMLASAKMKQFMEEASQEFDIVLFDVPPILPVTDAAILSNRADATLLIYRTGKVPRAALKRAKVQIESVGANVLGVVLNDLKADIAGYAGSHYYYGRYYGRPDQKTQTTMKAEEKNGFIRKIGERIKETTSMFSKKEK
ncbi:polysaccharide biosynthesis tyrosine autokinase [bacterium]|nr:polysaccharide biosynthesis tyrosine autokinase [bacterium]